MLIYQIIESIKEKHRGEFMGVKLSEKTKDLILYGNPEQECTGIAVTCFASVDVIEKAIKLGCNLIIVHEALFWNHGDKTDWLKKNEAFKLKKKLLDDHHIVVWRDHDYIHSGIKIDDRWYDGIFYGVMKEIGFENYLINDNGTCNEFIVPRTPTKEFISQMIDRFELTGTRCLGNMDGYVEHVLFPMHIMGEFDNSILEYVNDNNVDTMICMECTDYTVAEYIRDCGHLGLNKRIIGIGHFNVEELGMKYFARILPEMIGMDLAVHYIKSGDSYRYF